MRILLIAASLLALAGTAHAHGVKRADLQSVDHNPNTCDWVRFDDRSSYVDCTGKAFDNWKIAFGEGNHDRWFDALHTRCTGEHACPNLQLVGYFIWTYQANTVSAVTVTAPY